MHGRKLGGDGMGLGKAERESRGLETRARGLQSRRSWAPREPGAGMGNGVQSRSRALGGGCSPELPAEATGLRNGLAGETTRVPA